MLTEKVGILSPKACSGSLDPIRTESPQSKTESSTGFHVIIAGVSNVIKTKFDNMNRSNYSRFLDFALPYSNQYVYNIIVNLNSVHMFNFVHFT